MPKIKLAYVTHGLSSNGIESFLVNIAYHIDMTKYDVYFVIAIDEGTDTLHEKTVRDLGAKVIRVCDLDSIKKKFVYIKALRKVFEENKFDIVHANMDLLNGVVLRAAKKAGIKKRICHAHTSSSTFVSENSANKLFTMVQTLYRNIMKRLIADNSTHFLGCSQKANEYMYPDRADEAITINNGIDISKFLTPDSMDYDQNGIDPGKINLVTVGRLSAPKNPMFMIDIIAELSKLRQNFMFNWVGDGDLKEDINKYIEQKNLSSFINMMGRRTDIPQILSQCSIFLLPSLFEGLPVSLVEAQAAGLQCFVSSNVTDEVDFGGCRFISLDSGAKNWAEIIDQYINLKETPCIDKEKLMKFDITYTVNQLNNVYMS